jgi:iron complex transport system substrate-binding protein
MDASRAALSDASAASPPQRIVSLNPCLDAILVRVADRRHIAALSHYSRDAQSSSIAAVARTLPFTYESAEEIIALQPDLVLASRHSGVATRQALTRLGIAVATFGVPGTVSESVAQIREVAAHVGRGDRGEALVAQVEGALKSAGNGAGRRPIQALVFQSGGLVAGKDTLIGEVMQGAGFENVAARYGVGSWGTLSLEKLLADPPELLLSGRPRPGAPSWSERLIAHPALGKIAPRMRRAEFPPACLYCGGPVLIETARVLAEARTAFWSVS